MMRLLLALLLAATALLAAKPETVMVTCHANAGAAGELQRVLDRHWKTISELGLVTADPHVRVKGLDAGGATVFVEIFTWRDASVPDHAPAAVQSIWSDLNRLATVEISEVERW